MKQEKICISKRIMIFAGAAVFLFGFVVFTNYLNGQKVGQKPKADEPNPVHVPYDKQKIKCPVVGELKAWMQTEDPVTYYANTGVCAGSDDPDKVYNLSGKYKDGEFQVCCNESINFDAYMRINGLDPSISCPGEGTPRKYSFGEDGKCYKIDGKVLWGGTPNQVCGNKVMDDDYCCLGSNGQSNKCQDVAPTGIPQPTNVPTPTVEPTKTQPEKGEEESTKAPTDMPLPIPTVISCPPNLPYKYVAPLNGVQTRCFLVNGSGDYDNGKLTGCVNKEMNIEMAKCCVNSTFPGCQPTSILPTHL